MKANLDAAEVREKVSRLKSDSADKPYTGGIASRRKAPGSGRGGETKAATIRARTERLTGVVDGDVMTLGKTIGRGKPAAETKISKV